MATLKTKISKRILQLKEYINQNNLILTVSYGYEVSFINKLITKNSILISECEYWVKRLEQI